jgi:hypothetical protein
MDRTKPIGLFPPVRLSGGATGQRRQDEQGREKEPMRVERREEMTLGGLLLYEATARGIWQEIIAGAMGMEGLLD